MTVAALIAGVVLIGAGIGILMIAEEKSYEWNKKKILVACIVFGLAAGSLLFSLVNLNHNQAESERACFDKGGYIYQINNSSKVCVDRIPQIIHKL